MQTLSNTLTVASAMCLTSQLACARGQLLSAFLSDGCSDGMRRRAFPSSAITWSRSDGGLWHGGRCPLSSTGHENRIRLMALSTRAPESEPQLLFQRVVCLSVCQDQRLPDSSSACPVHEAPLLGQMKSLLACECSLVLGCHYNDAAYILTTQLNAASVGAEK